MSEKIAVIGAGAWGTALAKVLAECGHVAQMEDPRSTARGMLALWQDAAADKSTSTAGVEAGNRPDHDQVGRAAPKRSPAYGNLVA